MGSFDTGPIVDLVGIYILDTLGRFLNLNYIRIYGDGLISIPNSNGSLTSKMQKKVIRAFKYMRLKIEINSNLKYINFLDATFNLNDNSYKPFSKTNVIPTHINVCSNHSTAIVKFLMRLILDLTEYHFLKTFNNHKEFYNKTILNSGYKNELKNLETNRHHNNRSNNIGNNRTNNNTNMDNEISKNINKNRRRNIIWFNPPYIKIGKYFLGLMNKHFKDDNPLGKIINKNHVKISYSCTNNISKINKTTSN